MMFSSSYSKTIKHYWRWKYLVNIYMGISLKQVFCRSRNRGVGTFRTGTYPKKYQRGGGCFWQKLKSTFGTFWNDLGGGGSLIAKPKSTIKQYQKVLFMIFTFLIFFCTFGHINIPFYSIFDILSEFSLIYFTSMPLNSIKTQWNFMISMAKIQNY